MKEKNDCPLLNEEKIMTPHKKFSPPHADNHGQSLNITLIKYLELSYSLYSNIPLVEYHRAPSEPSVRNTRIMTVI